MAGGLATAQVVVPTMGRRRIALSIVGESITSGGGSITWSVSGINLLASDSNAFSAVLTNVEVLQAATVESADFDESYLYDGEWDEILLQLDETTACDCTLSGIVKAWD